MIITLLETGMDLVVENIYKMIQDYIGLYISKIDLDYLRVYQIRDEF